MKVLRSGFFEILLETLIYPRNERDPRWSMKISGSQTTFFPLFYPILISKTNGSDPTFNASSNNP